MQAQPPGAGLLASLGSGGEPAGRVGSAALGRASSFSRPPATCHRDHRSRIRTTLHEELGTPRARPGDSCPRGRLRPEAARRPSARRPGVPEHLPRRDVEPRFPDRLPALQRSRRRGVRAGVPARAAGTAGADGVGPAADHARVADAGARLRRVRAVGLVRVGLHERRVDAAPGPHRAARGGSVGARSADRDRRGGDVRQPRAAGALRGRDCRR